MSIVSFSYQKSAPECIYKKRLRLPRIHPIQCARKVLAGLDSLLVMKSLHQKVGLAGRLMAQRAVDCAPPKVISSINSVFKTRRFISDEDFLSEDFDNQNPCFGLLQNESVEASEYTPVDAMVATAGLASRILFYGAFSIALGVAPIPIENWHIVALTLGPWWSSSLWTEWVCYDFFMSGFCNDSVDRTSSDEKRKQGAVDTCVKFFPYEFHPELGHAYKYNKRSFFFCAMMIASLYLLVFIKRPPVTDIMLQKAKESYNPELPKGFADLLLDFVERHPMEIDNIPMD